MQMKMDYPLSSNSLEVLYHLAYNQYKNGKYRDACNQFGFLTLIDPFTRRNWMGLGCARQMLKEYDKALQAYEIAAAQDITDPCVYIYTAQCLFEMNRVEEGISALEIAERTANKQENVNHRDLKVHISLLRNAWENRYSMEEQNGQ